MIYSAEYERVRLVYSTLSDPIFLKHNYVNENKSINLNHKSQCLIKLNEYVQ